MFIIHRHIYRKGFFWFVPWPRADNFTRLKKKLYHPRADNSTFCSCKLTFCSCNLSQRALRYSPHSGWMRRVSERPLWKRLLFMYIVLFLDSNVLYGQENRVFPLIFVYFKEAQSVSFEIFTLWCFTVNGKNMNHQIHPVKSLNKSTLSVGFQWAVYNTELISRIITNE
jgi:hypothetical protein